MDKKVASDFFDEKAKHVEEILPEVKEIVEFVKKQKMTVYAIEEKDIVLVDEFENGIRLPMSKEYRNLKKGSIVYI